MKPNVLIAAAIALSIAACKTPYKATDQPINSTDSTAISTDTSAAMKRIAGSTTDSVFTKQDSTRVDSIRQPADPSVMPSKKDSATTQQMADTSRAIQEMDSTRNDSGDTTLDNRPGDPSSMSDMQAPAEIESVFNKQYPGATNVAWSAYDSLAAVPIDLRLAGWKKMDADDYMVKFEKEDETYYAWYENDGKWVGSASPMTDFTKLPAAVNAAVKNAIKSRYTDYNISQVNTEFQKGKKAYEVELTNGDNKVKMLVTAAGKITQIYKYASQPADK